MNEYIPMKGPLPGKQWQPSNSSSGEAFLSDWCGNCARDDDEKCPIIGASFRGEAVEWRETDEGVSCLAYVEAGQPIPPPKDGSTLDMFAVPT